MELDDEVALDIEHAIRASFAYVDGETRADRMLRPRGGENGVRPVQRLMRITLFVTGMHCEGCCQTVEAAIMAVPGLESCKIRVGVAEVEYDESRARKSDLVAAVRRAGAFEIERFEAVN